MKAFCIGHIASRLRSPELKVGLHPIGKNGGAIYLMSIATRLLAGKRAEPKPLSPTRDEMMKSLTRALQLEELDVRRPLRVAGPAAPRLDDLEPTLERK
jgi:hypothetical protein